MLRGAFMPSFPHVCRQPRMCPLQMCRRCSRLCVIDRPAPPPLQPQSPAPGNLSAYTVNALQHEPFTLDSCFSLRLTPRNKLNLFTRSDASERCCSEFPVHGRPWQAAREAEIRQLLQHFLLFYQVFVFQHVLNK